MPNYCDFDMKVVGKAKNVKKLVEWLEADYSYYQTKKGTWKCKCSSQHHFYRVFEVYYNEEVLKEAKNKETIEMVISGYCAWSVHSCMFEGDCTYYNSNLKQEYNQKLKHITLPEACKELSLDVHIISNESGMCFAEEYLINNKGEVLKDESYEYIEEWLGEYETKEEAEKALGKSITDNQWEDQRIVECELDFYNPKWLV